ncbi:hypothetical protein [Nonomuraea mesophila]|uniref:hypothetical protein n=1 Tax=Nonomuraea mesophila TaxID=2530382 RepID=UPI00140D7F5E|nr:hypothetical protein [Nonomuraea mesophila]
MPLPAGTVLAVPLLAGTLRPGTLVAGAGLALLAGVAGLLMAREAVSGRRGALA